MVGVILIQRVFRRLGGLVCRGDELEGVGRRRNVGPCAFCLAPLTFLLNLRFLFLFFSSSFLNECLFYIGNAFENAVKKRSGVEEENKIYEKKKK